MCSGDARRIYSVAGNGARPSGAVDILFYITQLLSKPKPDFNKPTVAAI